MAAVLIVISANPNAVFLASGMLFYLDTKVHDGIFYMVANMADGLREPMEEPDLFGFVLPAVLAGPSCSAENQT